ncbi:MULTISPECIES: hypothetical protein [unclassified Cryobacterium]|uniref:hypothetical protein n=1 Tax=unclassified Cryobacterium TaxID=2649013 RepID=UPI000CE570A4|nr:MULTISPECIES: hypothetical protein [unclassified Cryobacterium]
MRLEAYPTDQVAGRLADLSTVWLTEYRVPGTTKVDDYDLAMLRSEGFAVTKTFTLHSDVVYELRRQQ